MSICANWSFVLIAPTLQAPLAPASILHAIRQRPVDYDVHARDEARARAGQEHGRVRDLLGGGHAAPGILPERGLEEVGHVLLDLLPHPTLEIGVAGRHRVHPDV